MITASQFYGKCEELTNIAADENINPLRARGYVVSAAGGGPWSLILPSGLSPLIKTGAPIFYIYNKGSNTFQVKNITGGVICNIAAGEVTLISLSRASNAGVWIYITKTKL